MPARRWEVHVGKVVLSSKEATWAPTPCTWLPTLAPALRQQPPLACSKAPILWHTELTSLPTFSKLCPHVGHLTASEPQSLVSRGKRHSRAPWGAIPSILEP